MKLKTYLATLDDDAIISIGAKDGSNYTYIGRAGDVDLINKVFNDGYLSAVRKLDSLKDDEKKWFMNISKLGKRKLNSEIVIHEHAKELSKIYSNINKTENFVNNYINPLTRDVVSTNNRIYNGSRQVIVTGSEIGQFWFKSEFDKQYG